MSQLFAFRRTLVACVMALCAIVIVASASPADARPRHRNHHASYQNDHRHHIMSKRSARKNTYSRRSARRSVSTREHHARRAPIAMRYENRRAARLQKLLNANAALTPPSAMLPQDGVSVQTNQATAALMSPLASMSPHAALTSGRSTIRQSASNVVAEARRYIGGNPTGRKSLWCARFMNMVLQRSGHRTTGSDMARSFASYGQRISGPQVGAIAVMSRGHGGGHVGVVSGVDGKGNPIVVSGNHGRRVAESVYSRSRIYAYVMPN